MSNLAYISTEKKILLI